MLPQLKTLVVNKTHFFNSWNAVSFSHDKFEKNIRRLLKEQLRKRPQNARNCVEILWWKVDRAELMTDTHLDPLKKTSLLPPKV